MRKQERIEKETMAISHFRRFTALTLSCCLLFSAVQLPSCAAEESAETGTPEKNTLFVPAGDSVRRSDRMSPEERVKIIVELEEKPLLSYMWFRQLPAAVLLRNFLRQTEQKNCSVPLRKTGSFFAGS